MSSIREEDKHYCAGLFDGDASIGIERRRDDGMTLGYCMRPRIEISQIKTALEWTDEILYDGKHDRHYLGGLFDSDGSIRIGRRRDDGRTLGYYMRPIIGVKMNKSSFENPTRSIVREFFEQYDSDISVYEIPGPEGHSPQWEIRKNGYTALEMMEDIKPYLRLKKPKADLILSVDWDRVAYSRYEMLYAVVVHEEIGKDHNTDTKISPEDIAEHLNFSTETLDRMRDQLKNDEVENREVVDDIKPDVKSVRETSW